MQVVIFVIFTWKLLPIANFKSCHLPTPSSPHTPHHRKSNAFYLPTQHPTPTLPTQQQPPTDLMYQPHLPPTPPRLHHCRSSHHDGASYTAATADHTYWPESSSSRRVPRIECFDAERHTAPNLTTHGVVLWLTRTRAISDTGQALANKVRKTRAGVARYFNATINQRHQTTALKWIKE